MEIVSWKPFMFVVFLSLLWILIIRNKKQRKKILISLGSRVLFFSVSELFFKHILVDLTWIRERPYVAHADVISPIWTQFPDSSFPSSHMTITLAILTVLAIFWTWSRPFAILFALLMAISRIHNGMHYTTDVLAWSLLWIVCWYLWVLLWNKISKKMRNI